MNDEGNSMLREEKRACARLSKDVCQYLQEIEDSYLVTEYNIVGRVQDYSCLKYYILLTDMNNRIIARDDTIDTLNKKIDELNKEIVSLKSSSSSGSGTSSSSRKRKRDDSDVENLRAKIRRLENTVQSGSRRIKKATKRMNNSNTRAQNPPPSVPITSPSQWINRVKEVTHCQNLTEKCKMVCPACKWDYRKKEVQVKSHIAHLKAKHGGFTPSMVDGQNSHENLIPKLLEIGEKEQERRGSRQQQQTRAMAASRRQSRLDQYNLNRSMVLPP